jgi:Na+/H+-translocating membrane pyrophosphatase
VRANVRVAGAARRTAREALQVALRAGGFSGLMVVGMTVLGVTVLFSVFYVCFGVGQEGALHVADGVHPSQCTLARPHPPRGCRHRAARLSNSDV